jgi:uncharacterized protein (TIGR03435 family)
MLDPDRFDIVAQGRGDGAALATAVAERPALFTGLEEQLGLKRQAARAPITVTVIDRVAPRTTTEQRLTRNRG